MITARLIRIEENFQHGTFGVFILSSEAFCVTLEPADLLNVPFESSIPAQQYICRRRTSEKFGETFEIMDVPGRDDVLFHPGNRIDDTEGCVCLGSTFYKFKGDRAVDNSGKTFEKFMDALIGVHEFHLTIKEVY